MTPLLSVPLSDQTVSAEEILGATRATFDVGGSQQASAGSGASVFYVEDGRVSVIPADDECPLLVMRQGGGDATGRPEAVPVGGDAIISAGDGLILPADRRAEMRNDGDAPANVLRLLAASDAATAAETGVSRAALVSDVEALASPASLTLERTTLAAGAQLQYGQAPTQAVVAGVDRGQAVYLSMGSAGSATNRSPAPMVIYVVTLAPAA